MRNIREMIGTIQGVSFDDVINDIFLFNKCFLTGVKNAKILFQTSRRWNICRNWI